MSERIDRRVVSRSLWGAALVATIGGVHGPMALGGAALLIAAGAVVPRAMAQSNDDWVFGGFSTTNDIEMWGFSSPRPPFTRGMLTRAFDRLGLSADQREVAQSVYDAFEQEYLSMWLEHAERSSDERMEQMASQDWQAMQEQGEQRQEEYRKRMKGMLDAFMLDFELMLSPEQTKIWEQIELDKKRGEHLALASDGKYKPVDLAVVIDALKLDDSTKATLAPIIEAYHRDIDAALVPALRQAERVLALGRESQTAQRDMMKLYQDGEPDMEAVQRLQVEQVSKGESARDAALDLHRMYGSVLTVQRRAVEEIRRDLPAQHHAAFEKATVQRDDSQGFNWDSYSRFNMAAQSLENLEQTRAMMDMQLTMMSDGMDEEESGMVREMVLMMRRAKPLTPEQKRTLDRIRAEHKQAMDELESGARRRANEAKEAQQSNWMQIRVPGGVVSLHRVDENGNQLQWRPDDNGQDQEVQRRRARIDQQAIDEFRGILDFYQRALIANF